ncbi:MAG: DHH family phosphoesterase [Patescibacteria group bacterium]
MLKADQQFEDIIAKSENILICLPQTPTTDAIASGLAVLLFLEKKNKKPRIVASEFVLPHTHSFLPRSSEIFSDISALRKFIISVDLGKTKVQELNYETHGDRLSIYITPTNGFISKENVSSYDGEYNFDLIITLDAPDFEALGSIYENNVELFYKVPIINIDHSPANEHFGQINIVEVTATSTSEIIFEMLQRLDPKILDEFIATNLLTGIISKTKSFKTTSVTPRSLAIASHLISSGARREEIVRNLYQNKSIHTLKLWGRALTKLQKDFKHNIVWSVLEAYDFIEAGATEDELEKVIDELIVNTPDAKNIFIIYHKPDFGSKVLINTVHYIKADQLFREYYIKGSPDFTFLEFKNLGTKETEKIILERLSQSLQN